MSRIGILAGALGVALMATPAAAQDKEWARAVAESGRFSIETPCTAEEVASQAMLPGGKTAPVSPSRVMCRHRGAMFTAVIREVPIPADYDGPSAFDMMLSMGGKAIEETESIKVREVAGRRSITNQELRDGKLARTLVIELAPNALLMLISGGPFEEGYALEEIEPMIDRFENSLEITE